MLISLTLVVKRECLCATQLGIFRDTMNRFSDCVAGSTYDIDPPFSISGLPSHGPEKNIKNVLISSCPTTHTHTHTTPIHEKRTAPPACLHKLAVAIARKTGDGLPLPAFLSRSFSWGELTASRFPFFLRAATQRAVHELEQEQGTVQVQVFPDACPSLSERIAESFLTPAAVSG